MDTKTDIRLWAVMNRHRTSCDWKEGRPVKYWIEDGFICVKYESGNWWHYDLNMMTWF